MTRSIKTLAQLRGISMTAAVALAMATGIGVGLVGNVARAHDEIDPRSSGFENETPKELSDIGINEHLGEKVDLGLTFNDEDGKPVTLGSFTSSHKPLLLSLAYYSCPSLCNYHLNGLNDAFKQLKAPIGQEFEVVVVSIEPKETAELARAKKAAYIDAYGRPEGAKGWHFLTGSKENIEKLASQVGFNYRWDEKQKQWAHASAAYAITPEGRLSRYFYGIVFDPKFVRLSMVEASNGFIGTIADKITLFCFHFDPKENKYTVAAFNIMRAGGGITVVVMAAFLLPFWIRARKRERDGGSDTDVQGEA